MRFIGDYTAKTDAKGRVFLPAPLRRTLESAGEERLVLRNDLFQHCLVLYPESEWNSELDDLKSRLNRYNSKHQMMLRRFVADAELVELDRKYPDYEKEAARIIGKDPGNWFNTFTIDKGTNDGTGPGFVPLLTIPAM